MGPLQVPSSWALIWKQRLELHKEQKLEEHGLESYNALDGFVSEFKTKVGSTSLWIQELKVSAIILDSLASTSCFLFL